MDIDIALKNTNFSKEEIIRIIKSITSTKLNDNAKLSYLGISPIREDDEYGGYRVDILIEIENIKEKFHIDIATGDPITPKESNLLKQRWNTYQRKYEYAKNINFNEIIACIEQIINQITPAIA